MIALCYIHTFPFAIDIKENLKIPQNGNYSPPNRIFASFPEEFDREWDSRKRKPIYS